MFMKKKTISNDDGINAILKKARLPANAVGNSEKFTKRVLWQLVSVTSQKSGRFRTKRRSRSS